jgi:hypothetical protein
MKRLKIAGLALVAALALSAATVASASAVGELELVNHEGKELVKKHFTGESGESRFETGAGRKLTCTKTKIEGTVKNTKEGEATISSTGCTSSGISCNTAGAKSGEVTIGWWVVWGWLYIPPSHYDEGWYQSYLPYGTATVAIECSSLEKLTLKNGLVASVTELEVGKLTKEFTLQAHEKKGEQEATKFKLIDSEEASAKEAVLAIEGKGLESFAFEKAGDETAATKLKFEEEVKLVEN